MVCDGLIKGAQEGEDAVVRAKAEANSGEEGRQRADSLLEISLAQDEIKGKAGKIKELEMEMGNHGARASVLETELATLQDEHKETVRLLGCADRDIRDAQASLEQKNNQLKNAEAG